MKGDLTLKALEILIRGAYVLEAFFLAFTMPYGTSMGRALREVDRHVEKREKILQELLDNLEKRRQLHNLLYRLKKQGLVAERADQTLRLTVRGKQKLKQLRGRKSVPSPTQYMFGKESGVLYVVTFDIPEAIREKRRWLRAALTNNKFRMLHQSVWVGKSKPTEDFLEDLADLGILEYIHIFSISSTGSITKWPT